MLRWSWLILGSFAHFRSSLITPFSYDPSLFVSCCEYQTPFILSGLSPKVLCVARQNAPLDPPNELQASFTSSTKPHVRHCENQTRYLGEINAPPFSHLARICCDLYTCLIEAVHTSQHKWNYCQVYVLQVNQSKCQDLRLESKPLTDQLIGVLPI